MKKKNILVTGGAGFIGSNLVCRLVNDGYHVTVLDKLLRGNKIKPRILDKVKFVHGDVKDCDIVNQLSKNCDTIFHFAALLGVDLVANNHIETMDTEAIGARNVANAAISNGVERIIYASTSGIYGKSSMEKAVDEEILVDPKTSYAMAKRFNEIYFSSLNKEKDINTICLRFFNIYGDTQDNRMVIPRFFEQAIANTPITVFGSGNQTRDFTHIDDAIEACIQIMEKIGGNEIYNIANENEESILNLAKMIKMIAKSDSEIKLINNPLERYDFEVERRVGSSNKLFLHTGFKPSTDLIEGLRRIYSREYSRNT